MFVLDIALQDLILTIPEEERCVADTFSTDCDGSSKAFLFNPL
jgi:hypothetical protein